VANYVSVLWHATLGYSVTGVLKKYNVHISRLEF
jgi:hypothetical protein